MDHKLKHKWRSYLLVEVLGVRYLYPDLKDNIIDLTKIKETGEIDDGGHSGHKLKGQATAVSSGGLNSFAVTFKHVDGTKREYSGFLVHESADGNLILAGRVKFGNALRFTIDGVTLEQEEGTWVATKP